MAVAKPKVLEKDIQRAVVSYLRALGWFVVVNVTYTQTIGAMKGIADLVAVKRVRGTSELPNVEWTRTIWLEVKTPKGRQSEHQKRFQEEIERQGGEYLLARSVDDVIEYLAD